MDFFAAQERARGRTRSLVVLFILGVAGLVLTLNLLAVVGVGIYRANAANHRHGYGYSDSGDGENSSPGWNPAINVVVTLGTLAIVGGACLTKINELKAGGGAVALSVGATPLPAHPADFAERQLRNVVEEMALASGVPVPDIYVMEQEEGINAFAAGLTTQDATITVTRGALKYLTREELQGVIGHEFSHILNGDMRLNVELIGAVFGLLVIAIIGRTLLYSLRGSNFRGRNGGQVQFVILAAGVALVALGSLGVLFGRLIQSAVSRQREQLADASSVQFTRNPEGLAGALKKIGGLGAGSIINHAHAQETAHMYIAPALDSVFATHPPLEQRIRELEPNWDGKFINPAEGRFDEGSPLVVDVPPVAAATTVEKLLAPASVVAALSLARVRDWRASLPANISAALSSVAGCRALTLALSFDRDAAQCQAQIAHLQEEQEPATDAAAALLLDLATVAEGRRLPLLELALAGLGDTPSPEKNYLLAHLRELTGFDRGGQNLYQFALFRVARCRLAPQPPRLGPPQTEHYRQDISMLLSALAHLSTPNDAAALPVYQQGLTALTGLLSLPLTPRVQAILDAVESACLRLEGAPFALKKQLLEAGAIIVQADGVIEPAEEELLRAIAASLGCPVPLS